MKSSLLVSVLLLAGVAIGCSSDSAKRKTLAGSGGAAATGGTGDGLKGGAGGVDGGAPGLGGTSAAGGNSGAGGGPGTGGTPIDAGALVGQTISGTVDSEVQGEGRTVVLIWEVSSGSPDYAYKFGEGTVMNGRFSITLPGDPPAEAINSYGVGIAVVVVLPAGKTLAEGKLSKDAFGAADIAGVSSRYGVIWKASTLNLPSAPPTDFWPLSFPAGYSCGACAPKPDGGSFERFTPSACDHIQVTTYNRDGMCNWT